jgi:hypothetical protein
MTNITQNIIRPHKLTKLNISIMFYISARDKSKPYKQKTEKHVLALLSDNFWASKEEKSIQPQ